MRSIVAAAATLAALSLLPLPAAAADPDLPPGRDPSGVAVALVGPGIDYTRPEIAKRLARDGEGELIGWDFVDKDNRPFAPRSVPDPAVEILLARDPAVRLIPVRLSAEPDAYLLALSFAAATPAQQAVITRLPATAEDWAALRRVASQLKQLSISVLVCPAESAPQLVPIPAADEPVAACPD